MKKGIKEQQVTLFYIITIIFWFSLFAYAAELTTYSKSLGASLKIAGIISGIYGITQVILRLIQGILSDKYNKRKIFISGGLLIGALSSLIPFIFPSLLSLFLCRLFAGLTATTWVSYTILFTAYFKSSETPKAMGILNSFNYIGKMLAMLLGGVLAYSFGTKYLFLLSSIISLIGFILSLYLIEDYTLSPEPITIKQIIEVSKDRLLIFYSILGCVSHFISFATVYSFTPIVAVNNFAANSMQLGILAFLYIIPSAIISPISSTFLIKKFSERLVILTGFILATICSIVVPFAPSIIVLYIINFVAGVGKGMEFPLLMGLCIKHFTVETRATAMGFYQSFYSLGIIVGPILFGFISESFGILSGFIFTGFIGFIAIIMVSLKCSLN